MTNIFRSWSYIDWGGGRLIWSWFESYFVFTLGENFITHACIYLFFLLIDITSSDRNRASSEIYVIFNFLSWMIFYNVIVFANWQADMYIYSSVKYMVCIYIKIVSHSLKNIVVREMNSLLIKLPRMLTSSFQKNNEMTPSHWNENNTRKFKTKFMLNDFSSRNLFYILWPCEHLCLAYKLIACVYVHTASH